MRALIEAAGFAEVDFSTRRWHAFDGAPFESNAAEFGTEGAAVFAVKPVEPLPEVLCHAGGAAPGAAPVEAYGGGAVGWRC